MPSRNSPSRYRSLRDTKDIAVHTLTQFDSAAETSTTKIWPENAELSPHDEVEFSGERNGFTSNWPGEVWDVFEQDGLLVYEVIVDNLGEDSISTWHVHYDGEQWLGKHIRDSDYMDK